MDIKDLKVSIALRSKSIKKQLTDLETILESEGLKIRSVDIKMTDWDISTYRGSETLKEIQLVKIEVVF